ncbi:hypothetical protein CONPUDRAFT_155465 [Coniophora puteana RWD-64-598 SS2]|uniref:Ubiquitin-like protease family profile domain-containing protein n=1 Tax=Coniophora puteana (strain RWD-64-598) TaxID=741705 RepID=A0A5M3MM42_CONPW|nr:uncharacterized protein CONPUDRAFT_155465 [Coniophora puteana RWD-64-598 SS2]EIW80097.1 hypothetical protein CONPUDRAFT_155465 [Coniophora puteana RWD-64-598 SS2]
MAAHNEDDDQEFPSKIGRIAMDDDGRFTRSLHAISQLPDTAPLVQVHKALHETQEEHGALFDAYCSIKDQVRMLYALLPKDKKKSFDRGLSLQSMIFESKFKSKGSGFSKFIRPWVAEGTFLLSPLARSIDCTDPSRFKDEKAMALGNMANEEAFATTFTQAVDAVRHIYTTALCAAEASIFGPQTVERKLSLLKKNVKSPKYNQHVPVLYANPERPLPQEFLTSEILVKAMIVKLFGPTGLKLHQVRRPRSKAKGTQLMAIELAMIASSMADVRYLLLNDPTYVNPGLPSGIPYNNDRDHIPKILFTGNAVWTFKVREFFNYKILGIPPSSSDHPVLKELLAPVHQEKDEDEELMAGLDKYYAPKPSVNSESPSAAVALSAGGLQSLSALTKQVHGMNLDPTMDSCKRLDNSAEEVEHQGEGGHNEDDDGGIKDEDDEDDEDGEGEGHAKQAEDPIPTAYLQAVIMQEEGWESEADFVIFSSYLGAIASGEIGLGSIREHVEAPCMGTTLEGLMCRPRWIFPLCKNSHWVVGWIDFGDPHLGVFDSIPEYHLESWAFPMLEKAVNTVLSEVGHSPIMWGTAGFRTVCSGPPPLEQQMDGWSCGLFAMMAMHILSRQQDLSLIGNSQLSVMKMTALDAILHCPVIWRMEPPAYNNNDDVEVVEDPPSSRYVTSNGSVLSSPGSPIDKPNNHDRGSGSNKRKRTPDSEPDMMYEELSRTLEELADCNTAQQTDTLSDSPNNDSNVDANTANVNVTIAGGVNESASNTWKLHRDRCNVIQQRVKVRISDRPTLQLSQSNKVTGYFSGGPSSKKPTPVKTSRATKYETRTFKNPPVLDFFVEKLPAPLRVAPSIIPTPSVSDAPRTYICEMLTGEKWLEYIRRSQTHVHGGVLFALQAHIQCELFPYKPFNRDTKPATNMPTIAPVTQLKAMNTETPFAKWTDNEKRAWLRATRSFACWIVDPVNEFVKSTRCPGTTTNAS